MAPTNQVETASALQGGENLNHFRYDLNSSLPLFCLQRESPIFQEANVFCVS